MKYDINNFRLDIVFLMDKLSLNEINELPDLLVMNSPLSALIRTAIAIAGASAAWLFAGKLFNLIIPVIPLLGVPLLLSYYMLVMLYFYVISGENIVSLIFGIIFSILFVIWYAYGIIQNFPKLSFIVLAIGIFLGLLQTIKSHQIKIKSRNLLKKFHYYRKENPMYDINKKFDKI